MMINEAPHPRRYLLCSFNFNILSVVAVGGRIGIQCVLRMFTPGLITRGKYAHDYKNHHYFVGFFQLKKILQYLLELLFSQRA